MTIVELKVSRFTRRIIENSRLPFDLPPSQKHTSTPAYQIYESDTLYLHLCNRRPRQRISPTKLAADLPDTIALVVSDAIAKNILSNTGAIGLYLNQIHRDELNQLLWWETRELHDNDCKLKATEVIALFCNRYKIEPDIDIAVEALNKSWTRFKQRMAVLQKKDEKSFAFFQKKEWQAVHTFSEKKQRKIHAKRVSDAMLTATIAAYIEKNKMSYFQTTKGTTRLKRTMQLQIYVWHVIGGRPVKLCAEKFKIKLSMAYYHITEFQAFLRHAPPILITEPLPIIPNPPLRNPAITVKSQKSPPFSSFHTHPS